MTDVWNSRWGRIIYSGVLILSFGLNACGETGSVGSSLSGSVSDEIGENTRSSDGQNDNTVQKEMGAANTNFHRLELADYTDGLSDMFHPTRPGPREISNAVFDQENSIENHRNLTSYVWQWGQLLDHDITLTKEMNPKEPVAIEIPVGDPFFDPAGDGAPAMFFNRSQYDPLLAEGFGGSREIINSTTSWIDASFLYGPSDERALWLRTLSGGKLKESEGGLMPFNDGMQDNKPTTDPAFFVAGDVRANEQLGLAAIHILFVREHNYWADKLALKHPDWSDERLYQHARRIVAGEVQAITYNEFLPAILGEDAFVPYAGYDSEINASISVEFATTFYRFGHTMLPPVLLRLNADGSEARPPLALRDVFFKIDEILANGIDEILSGLAYQKAQELDALVIDEVRNFLFGPLGSGQLQDLVSLNVHRGRDHGISDYNTMRVHFGLPPVDGFDDITSDPEMMARLQSVYVDPFDIDVFVGMLAEDHIPGTSTGPLLSAALKDQFERLRDGDRFWYEYDLMLSDDEVAEISSTGLGDIIRRNTGLTNIRDNVFVLP